MRSLAIVLVLATLAACQRADTQPGPGGVTVGEAKALDEAAEMIEDRRLDSDAIPAPSASAAQTAPAPQNRTGPAG